MFLLSGCAGKIKIAHLTLMNFTPQPEKLENMKTALLFPPFIDVYADTASGKIRVDDWSEKGKENIKKALQNY